MESKKKLRVVHIPQVGMGESFEVEVENLNEAKKIMDVLGEYDAFQYANKIKPDYANMTYLEKWSEDDEEWASWCDEETGIDDLDEYFEFLDVEK